MDKLHLVDPLAAFDALARGDAAPAWAKDEIVRAWGLGTVDVEVALIVVSENVTFRVRCAGLPRLVVRLGRPGYVDLAEVRSELQWVEALRRDINLPTPSPARGADGELVQSLRAPDGSEWTAVAFDHVTGVVLEDLPDFTAHFTEIGALTRRMHEHSRAWEAPIGFRRGRWGTDELVGAAARFGDWRAAELSAREGSTLERAESVAKNALIEATAAGNSHHFGLIHGDLRPSNVMVAEDGSATVIDFDDCGYGYYLYDFAAAITFYEHRPSVLQMARAWFQGYSGSESLPTASLRAANALSMLRRLTMLGWATTHRSDALPADLWDENLPGTVHVAEQFLNDPLWLTRF